MGFPGDTSGAEHWLKTARILKGDICEAVQ